MNRLHTLLAATDLSAPSRHAALRAAMLARETGARLEILHVLESSALDEVQRMFGDDGAALRERLRTQAREALTQLAADVGESQGVSAGQHLAEGAVLKAITAQADNLDASLLILGAHGAGFMHHWLLGANAERLLRKTLRPVLAVKQRPHEAYRSVLVPVDFSPWSQGAIRLAQAAAPHAELILMHAFEMPFEGKMRYAGVEEEIIQRHRTTSHQEALARLHQAASATLGVTQGWRTTVVYGDAAPRILEHEEEVGADLIVLGKHGAGMVEELLLGSTTKHVLAQSRCDVLVAYR